MGNAASALVPIMPQKISVTILIEVRTDFDYLFFNDNKDPLIESLWCNSL